MANTCCQLRMNLNKHMQFIRFLLLGILVNTISFGLYCLFTYFGLSPKFAMSIVYSAAVISNFIGQKSWVFKNKNDYSIRLNRYILIYVLGYWINWLLLEIFVERFKFVHEIVQASSIIIVAIFLYFTLNNYVFNNAQKVN